MPPEADAGAAPEPWTDPAPGRPVPFWASLAADVRAHIPPERRPRGRARWAWASLRIGLASAGLHLTFLHRLAHALRGRLGLPGRVASALLFWLGRHAYGCAIAPGARLHGGLMLPHPQGIVVGDGVELGPRGWIFQNATIGGAPGRPGLPRIGQDARIYAGAVISGPVRLGDRVQVGANAVVAQDVPPDSFVRPAPISIKPIPPARPERPGPDDPR